MSINNQKVDLINDLYRNVQKFQTKESERSKLTGSNFNIFELLGLETKEVTLHSKFIAELLNPNGSHSQGNVFLLLFLDVIDVHDFNTETARVDIEVHIGETSNGHTEGGRLDILISNTDKEIIIENKIHASLGMKQLTRYLNYSKQSKKDGNVYYLTLVNDLSSEPEPDEEKCISIYYEEHILRWLEACLLKVDNISVLKETLLQYVKVVRGLTNQTINKGMEDQIIKIFKENPGMIEAVDEANKTLSSLRNRVSGSYKKKLERLFEGEVYKLIDGIELEIYWKESIEGLWFGYRFLNHPNNGEFSSKLKLELERIAGSMNPKLDLKDSKYHFMWYTPTERKYNVPVVKMDVASLIAMDENESLIIDQIANIVNEANIIKGGLLSYLKETNLLVN